jgi:CheY-like chemotaxis protein
MNFKILLIEDSEDDTYFFKRALDNSEIMAEVTITTDGTTGIEAWRKGKFDCVFLDFMLPETTGLKLLEEARSEGIDTPVVMLTGQRNEQMAIQLMHAGANDYISKDALTSEALRLSIENAYKIYKANQEKLLAEAALKNSEARLAEAQKIASVGNWEYYMESKQLFLSEEASRILNFKSTPSFINFIKHVYHEDLEAMRDCFYVLDKTPSYGVNFRIVNSDKDIIYINAKGEKIKSKDGKVIKIIGTIQDITLLKTALNETKKAKIKSKATTIVFGVAILIFLISEAFLDPFVDALTTSLLISLSFKGGLALFLKPIESFLERFMLNRVGVS